MGEPAPSPELFEFSNVILTPHIGSATVEAREAMSLAVVENLAAMIRGERPPGSRQSRGLRRELPRTGPSRARLRPSEPSALPRQPRSCKIYSAGPASLG